MPRRKLDREQWQAVADCVLPGTIVTDVDAAAAGESHQVLMLPGVAVLRVARAAEAQQLMSRRLALLRRLKELTLPFLVPVPLSDAVQVHGLTACALTWVPGAMQEPGSGNPRQLRRLLDTLAEIDPVPLGAVLDQPHAYAGRERWVRLLTSEVIPRVPADARVEAVRRVEAACALPPVTPNLVHGDLAGANLLWDADGALSGVLDWDLASASDPAIDAACLAWFGWPTVRVVTSPSTYRRARTWFAVFGLEQVSAAVLDGRPEPAVDAAVARAANWLRRTVADPSD